MISAVNSARQSAAATPVTIEGAIGSVGKAVVSGIASVADAAVDGITTVAETAIDAATQTITHPVSTTSRLIGAIVDIWA